MTIDKAQIVQLLQSRGQDDKATAAEAELPDQVDTDQHAALLGKLGIDPADLQGLLGKLPGGLAGGFG